MKTYNGVRHMEDNESRGYSNEQNHVTQPCGKMIMMNTHINIMSSDHRYVHFPTELMVMGASSSYAIMKFNAVLVPILIGC